jgi:uncharacterized protein (UPF0335 family)
MSNGIAGSQLRSIVQRVERLRDEIKALNSDVAEVYKEARGNGFDVATLKALVSERAKVEKDPTKFQEFNALLDIYRAAFEGGTNDATRVHAHEEKPHSAPTADRAATQAGADRASKEAATGGDVDPTTASSPQHFNSALASPPSEPDSGEDRDAPPVRTSPDFIPETTSTPAPNTAVLIAQENAGPVPEFLRRTHA